MEQGIVDVVTQLISNCGFPIAAFLLMWHTCHTTLTNVTETVGELKKLLETAIDLGFGRGGKDDA